MLMFWEWWKYK